MTPCPCSSDVDTLCWCKVLDVQKQAWEWSLMRVAIVKWWLKKQSLAPQRHTYTIQSQQHHILAHWMSIHCVRLKYFFLPQWIHSHMEGWQQMREVDQREGRQREGDGGNQWQGGGWPRFLPASTPCSPEDDTSSHQDPSPTVSSVPCTKIPSIKAGLLAWHLCKSSWESWPCHHHVCGGRSQVWGWQ